MFENSLHHIWRHGCTTFEDMAAHVYSMFIEACLHHTWVACLHQIQRHVCIVFKCTFTPVFIFENILTPCLMSYLHHVGIVGPTWEFQICLKSCNLASWATKWHDYVPVDHPPHRLRNQPTHHIDSATDPPTTRRVTWNLATSSYLGRWNMLVVLGVSRGYLEGVWWVSGRCLI